MCSSALYATLVHSVPPREPFNSVLPTLSVSLGSPYNARSVRSSVRECTGTRASTLLASVSALPGRRERVMMTARSVSQASSSRMITHLIVVMILSILPFQLRVYRVNPILSRNSLVKPPALIVQGTAPRTLWGMNFRPTASAILVSLGTTGMSVRCVLLASFVQGGAQIPRAASSVPPLRVQTLNTTARVSLGIILSRPILRV